MGEWLRTSPLALLTLTVAAYQLGRWLRARTDGHPLAQPALVAIVVVAVTISVLDVDYDRYRADVDPIALLLGPATVALAVPLHRQAHRLRGLVLPALLAVVLGSVVSVTTAVLLVRLTGGPEVLERTVAPKAATTPVAIPLAASVHGIPELAAVLAIVIGLVGAVAGPAVLTLLRIRDARARGLALGAVSHGIGTSRLLHDDERQGAFSGLSMGLTALATSLVLPLLALLLW